MEWISIKDKLPTELEDVLTYNAISNEEAYETYIPICIGFYENGEFYSAYDYYEHNNYTSLSYVTHWMSLPELPKEREK